MLLLPKYFQTLGQTSGDIGVLMASASLGGLIIRPVIGWALDCYGKRVILTLGSTSLAAGMLMLSEVEPDFSSLLYARIFVGMGAGTLFTGYFAFVADQQPEVARLSTIDGDALRVAVAAALQVRSADDLAGRGDFENRVLPGREDEVGAAEWVSNDAGRMK